MRDPFVSFIRHRLGWMLVLALTAAPIAGCGGSSTDLDELYDLEATADQRGPAAEVRQMGSYIDEQLRNREGDVGMAVGEAQEMLAEYKPEEFGDKAPLFEQFMASLNDLQAMTQRNAPRAEIQEKVTELKDLGDQIAPSAETPPE